MANINISNLAEKTTVNDNDVLLVEDASSTNKVTKANLLKEVNAKINQKTTKEYVDGEISKIELTPGEKGEQGIPGKDGKSVELTKTATHIKWRYTGQSEGVGWTDLVAIADLKGDVGSQGEKGEKGDPGEKGADAVINELNKVDVLIVESVTTQEIATAFNNLIADLKAKGYMADA